MFQGPSEVLVTVISTLSLPVWIFKSTDADGFYTSNIGSDKLGVSINIACSLVCAILM